jgi:hypothetical protein
MKLVKEHINEKFVKNSDPISDMGIGGLILIDVHNEIKDEAANKWIDFLKNTLEGKTIRGIMMKWDDSTHNWIERTVFVKNIINEKGRHGFESEVIISDEVGAFYTVYVTRKIYIIK